MELRKRALGLSLGLVWGLAILLGTWWFIILEIKGGMLSNLGNIYIGYSVSWVVVLLDSSGDSLMHLLQVC